MQVITDLTISDQGYTCDLPAIQASNSTMHDAEELLSVLYDELRKLANSMVAREKPGQTIQPTELVHEAYLRLVGHDDNAWNGRSHFFGAAAEAMRRILIQRARRKAALCHGGGCRREEFADSLIEVIKPDDDLLAIDEVLQLLEQESETKAKLVKLRYFIGLTIPQAAEVMGISRATAERYWAYSRARLYQWLVGKRRGDSNRKKILYVNMAKDC